MGRPWDAYLSTKNNNIVTYVYVYSWCEYMETIYIISAVICIYL